MIREQDGAGYIAHTNHYLCPRYATRKNHEASLPDSFLRQERIDSLLADDSAPVGVESIQRFLSDHSNGPLSICRHPADGDSTGQTVASIIAEPAERRMHVAAGTPCSSRYVTYSMDG